MAGSNTSTRAKVAIQSVKLFQADFFQFWHYWKVLGLSFNTVEHLIKKFVLFTQADKDLLGNRRRDHLRLPTPARKTFLIEELMSRNAAFRGQVRERNKTCPRGCNPITFFSEAHF